MTIIAAPPLGRSRDPVAQSEEFFDRVRQPIDLDRLKHFHGWQSPSLRLFQQKASNSSTPMESCCPAANPPSVDAYDRSVA